MTLHTEVRASDFDHDRALPTGPRSSFSDRFTQLARGFLRGEDDSGLREKVLAELRVFVEAVVERRLAPYREQLAYIERVLSHGRPNGRTNGGRR